MQGRRADLVADFCVGMGLADSVVLRPLRQPFFPAPRVSAEPDSGTAEPTPLSSTCDWLGASLENLGDPFSKDEPDMPELG